tara:strand:+ start:203 stop:388 length:186 start_codon:yes stop_codon:yes gene_type:complete
MRGEQNDIIKSNGAFDRSGRVDLNDLMQKVREEEKKNKRSNVAISAAVVSAVAVFGIMLTL